MIFELSSLIYNLCILLYRLRMIQYRDSDIPEFKDKVIPLFDWEIPVEVLQVSFLEVYHLCTF